ncbi:MAG: hypothetical protein GY909_05755 [Oligoflexia bacterium]|nr:hypothetical protein [Oligoflexia bacterium]
MNNLRTLTFIIISMLSSTLMANNQILFGSIANTWKSNKLPTALIKSLKTIDKKEFKRDTIKGFVHHSDKEIVSEIVSVELKSGDVIYEEEIVKVETFDLANAFNASAKPVLRVQQKPVEQTNTAVVDFSQFVKPERKKPVINLNGGKIDLNDFKPVINPNNPFQINPGTLLDPAQIEILRLINGNGTGGG